MRRANVCRLSSLDKRTGSSVARQCATPFSVGRLKNESPTRHRSESVWTVVEMERGEDHGGHLSTRQMIIPQCVMQKWTLESTRCRLIKHLHIGHLQRDQQEYIHDTDDLIVQNAGVLEEGEILKRLDSFDS